MRFSSLILASLAGSLVSASPVSLQKRDRDPLPSEFTSYHSSSFSDPSSPAVLITTQNKPQDNDDPQDSGPVYNVNGVRYFHEMQQDPNTLDEDCDDQDNKVDSTSKPAPPADVKPTFKPKYHPKPTYSTSYTPPTNPTPFTPPTNPAPAPESQPPPTSGSFQQKMLDNHNNYRAMHGAPPVTWSDEMVGVSTANCQQCSMTHTQNNEYGENLAMGTNMDADLAAKMWYEEYTLYPWGSSDIEFDPAWGHFSQLVWLSASQIGCSQLKCADGNTYIACEYTTGNVAGEYIKNVKPKLN